MNEYIYFDAEHAVRVHDQIIINSGGILGIINYVSCPKIAIHKKSVYGTPRSRDLCFTRAQAEPF